MFDLLLVEELRIPTYLTAFFVSTASSCMIVGIRHRVTNIISAFSVARSRTCPVVQANSLLAALFDSCFFGHPQCSVLQSLSRCHFAQPTTNVSCSFSIRKILSYDTRQRSRSKIEHWAAAAVVYFLRRPPVVSYINTLMEYVR